METASKRDKALDCVCGILIIHMILGHIFQWSRLTGSYFYQCMNLLYFFMPWFFFKSGLFYKETPVRRVFAIGLHRLSVPFIVLSLIGHTFLCISLAMEGGHPWQTFWISPLKDILLLGCTTGSFPLWFLLSLFLTKTLYSLLVVKIPPAYIAGISFLCCLIIYRLHIQYPCYFPNTVCGLFFFSIGHQLKNIQYKKNLFCLSALIYVLTLALVPSFVDMRSNTLMSGEYEIWMIGAIAGSVTINNICRLAKRHLPRILCVIGCHSILFYIFHWIFLIITKSVIADIPVFQNHPRFELLAYMGVIVGCVSIYRLKGTQVIRFISGT